MNKRPLYLHQLVTLFEEVITAVEELLGDFFSKSNTRSLRGRQGDLWGVTRDSGESPVQDQSSLSLLPRVNLSKMYSARRPSGNLILSTLVRWSLAL